MRALSLETPYISPQPIDLFSSLNPNVNPTGPPSPVRALTGTWSRSHVDISIRILLDKNSLTTGVSEAYRIANGGFPPASVDKIRACVCLRPFITGGAWTVPTDMRCTLTNANLSVIVLQSSPIPSPQIV